jgi:hypothetical protein
MISTSGDLFYAVITAGLVVAFTGTGLSVASSWRVRVCGLGLFLLGACTILSTMAGITGVFARFLRIG